MMANYTLYQNAEDDTGQEKIMQQLEAEKTQTAKPSSTV